MASPDLSKLQEILAAAETNEAILAQVRKNFTQVEVLVGDIQAMLQPGYQPQKKERKASTPRTEGAKRSGRPRKDAMAE